MSDATLGQLPDDTAQRDAIHVAIAPVEAGAILYPGQHVILKDGKAIAQYAEAIGVVDPFLPPQPILPGQKFWLCLYQKTITGMRHHWSHPAFEEAAPALAPASEQWIRDFADRVGLHYNDLMRGAKEWIMSGEFLCRGGLLEGESVPDEFWTHYENVTGETVDEPNRSSFFTCSC